LLSPDTIKQYLARTLADYDWIKGFTGPQFDSDLAALNPQPDLNKLWLHQKACFLLLLELKRFMLFLDMGGGKTNITLQLLKYRKERGEQPKAIVFVPYITSVDTWVEECAKHTPSLKCQPLVAGTAANLASLSEQADLYVICYQSAVAMLSKKESDGWSLKAADVRAKFPGFDTLVCDEIHRCKSATSLTFRMCRAISAQCEYVLGLTGTPFGRDLGDLWPQFYLIDFGATLGNTFALYRESFFTKKAKYWGGYEYCFKQKMLPQLKQTIKNASISYTIDEFADMPPKDYVVQHIEPPEESLGYTQSSTKLLRDAIKSGDYKAVQSNYLRLRQLSSGFLTLHADDSDKLQVQFNQNPKLDALAELIEDMPATSKAVIFHHFIYTNKLISDKLKSMKVKHARIWGGQRDPIGELRKFKTDDKCRVLVINWKSGSSSLNLQGANYLIVFEQPESPIDRKQGEARVWRPGQTQRVIIYDLLVKNTVDSRLHKANECGKELLRELLDGKEL